MRIFTNVNIDFIRWRWHAIALSLAVIIAGAMMIVRGVPLGIDFVGGTNVVVRFEKPVTDDQVARRLVAHPGRRRRSSAGSVADRTRS